MAASKDLTKLRKKIDKADKQILDLLERRYNLTDRVGKDKLKSKELIHQSNRWEEVMSKLQSQAQIKGLPPIMVKDIWETIHKYSKKQQKLIHDESQKEQ